MQFSYFLEDKKYCTIHNLVLEKKFLTADAVIDCIKNILKALDEN